jgi:thiol-disulfide isomerase/thioredoxin
MSFHDVGGAARSISALAGHPAVLLFWRSDCAPCRLELGYLAGLEAAARPGRLVAIALEDAASARSTIARLPQPPTDAWVADRPAAEVLVAFNGQPPRLPLAVSLDRNGRVCQRHVGLLGTDRVHQWVRQCS